MVVLSACYSGIGKIQHGEGVYGLQRAFIVAGAKSVIMSLWKVQKDIPQKFMEFFYNEWIVNEKDKRQAFKIAQKEIRKNNEDALHWGSFVMVGE
ncbi:MAG: CHAT domain-containing protein [Proteobacteria bacterium]|nr:CHAT domain-containing protein [Desulfobacteraceae bacterium]MCP4354887.1 CHAT domain-containing protein [Pseudomonadota bacterium]